MKKTLLVIAVLISIAIAPFLIDEKGYILIAMGDLTLEMTVVSALLMLVIAGFIGILIYWMVRLGFRLTSSTWRKMLFASKARAKREFQQGLGAFLLGDYQRAEKLLASSAENSELSNSAWLLAAKASHQIGDSASTQNFLQLVDEHPAAKQNFSFETLLLAARLQMQTGHLDKARRLLDDHHTLIGHDARLIALDCEVNIDLDKYDAAIEGLKRLRKQKNADADVLYTLEFDAYRGLYQQLARSKSIDAVGKHYKGLSRKEKQSEGLIIAYADTLMANGLTENFENLVLPRINAKSSASFINAVKQLPISNAQHIIDAIQKILQKDPQNIMWLSALAHICYADNQTEKAHKAFISLFKIEKHKDDLLTYAHLLEDMGEYQQANRVYQEIV
ncbi:heme biosynthesis HemY N-terminal domain-containing protein [Thalassotalea sp. Y01]|uniref:heme biosynthesis HemY N-terminal domain-containing protein n=1 Tax=Thalassotalea sp. Y01 TaxID=2729613 RepID=UPI00145D3733|nr:heme biosynthesis HemY N-terminal domain-containing protein [Thalassotalea sp. Y01]NMP16062.1 hypothetical protein [Thalassotalea sp. Y01]